jgi:hypothetical protein
MPRVASALALFWSVSVGLSACGDDDRERGVADAGFDAGEADSGSVDVCGVTAAAGRAAFTWGDPGAQVIADLPVSTCRETTAGFLVDATDDGGGGAMALRVQLSAYDGARTYTGTEPEGVRVEVIDSEGRTAVNGESACDVCVNPEALSGTFSCARLQLFDASGGPADGSFRCP